MTGWITMISWCIPATQSLSNWVRCLHGAAIAVSHVAAQNRGWPSPQAAKDTSSKAFEKPKDVKGIQEIFQTWTHLKILKSSLGIPYYEFNRFFFGGKPKNAVVYHKRNQQTHIMTIYFHHLSWLFHLVFLRCNHGTCSTPLHVTRFQLCEELPSKRVLHSLQSKPRTPVDMDRLHSFDVNVLSSGFDSSRCTESDTRTELMLCSPPSPSLHSVHPAM